MAAAQTRIGATIDNFYGDSSETAMSANAYKRATDELDSTVQTQYVGLQCARAVAGLTSSGQDAPYRTTVLEPVGKLCSYFPEINNSLGKRHKKVRLRSAQCVRSVV